MFLVKFINIALRSVVVSRLPREIYEKPENENAEQYISTLRDCRVNSDVISSQWTSGLRQVSVIYSN